MVTGLPVAAMEQEHLPVPFPQTEEEVDLIFQTGKLLQHPTDKLLQHPTDNLPLLPTGLPLMAAADPAAIPVAEAVVQWVVEAEVAEVEEDGRFPVFIYLSQNFNMKFKIILLSAFFLSSFSFLMAQTSDAETDAIINLLGVQKREAVSRLVPVSGKDSLAFWKIYDEYLGVNKVNAKRRIALYERTANAYANLTPATADSLANKYFLNRMDQEKNIQLYYGKIKVATNAVIAFKAITALVATLILMRAQIMSQVPTYGQVQSMMKKN